MGEEEREREVRIRVLGGEASEERKERVRILGHLRLTGFRA